MSSAKQHYQQIAQTAYQLLSSHPNTLYNQSTQCEKLLAIGIKVSKGLFNKMVNNKDVSLNYLVKLAVGLQKIIALELAMTYDEQHSLFIERKDQSQPKTVIPIYSHPYQTLSDAPKVHFDGRRSIAEKVAFIKEAQSSVLFLGIRLRQFVSYFTHRKPSEFKDYIGNLLKKGIDIHCYLADPSSNKIKAYFEDRYKFQKKDKYGEALIPGIIEDLKSIQSAFAAEKLAGNFRVFSYNHYPTTHFIAVDLQLPTAKLLASNYLYGVARNRLPVVEVHKIKHSSVYSLYQESLIAIIKDAKEY